MTQPPLSVDGMTRGQLARRARLTTAVIELLEECTPDQLQMRQVTERSLVSLGAMYRYFSGKDHLLGAALTDWHAQFADRVERGLSDEDSSPTRTRAMAPDPTERMRAFVRSQLRGFELHPNFARLMTHLYASADPYASQELVRVSERNRATLAALLHDVPEEVARPASRAISSTMTLSIMHWQGGRITLEEARDSIDEVVTFVLRPGVPTAASQEPGLHPATAEA